MRKSILFIAVMFFCLFNSNLLFADPVQVDNSGYVGEYTSLTVVNGNPAISYMDLGNSALNYIRATDVSGTSWGTPVQVDNAATVGYYTSLAIVNGNPAISYSDQSNTALNYVRATDTNGTSWAAPVQVDNAGSVGTDTSLAIVNGNPAISYYDQTNMALKYVRAIDSSGASWIDAASASIPTLSEWGMITMVLLLAGASVFLIRKQQVKI